MSNDLIFAFQPIINASKDKDYKLSVTRNCTTLMQFLIEKNLLKVNPFDEHGKIKKDLVLYEKDFTHGGDKLFGKPVMKWFRYLDKGGSVSNLTILVKGLDEIKGY